MERIGVSFISVHGRTADQRTQPVNLEAIKMIKDSVSIPVVANGDITSIEEADMVYEKTKVNGSYTVFIFGILIHFMKS